MIVLKGKAMGNWTPEEMRRKPLTLENAHAIQERCPSVEHASPYLFPDRGIHKARYKGNDMFNLEIGGTEEGYAYGGTTMRAGRFFTDMRTAGACPWWWWGRAPGSRGSPMWNLWASGSRWTGTRWRSSG
jgi:hypothetical protein